MQLNVLIVEDEHPAQRLLARFINELSPQVQIVNMLDSVKDTIEWLQENPHPDIIFMDVQLSDGLCFGILEQIKPDSFIIFTTAYDQYAIQAFKANTIDYLLKPIKKEQIKSAMEKVNEQSRLYQKLHIQEFDVKRFLNVLQQAKAQYRERFLVGSAHGWYKLGVNDVAFFYLDNKVTYARDFKGRKHIIDQNLGQVIESLDPKAFFRTNRQFIVNIEAIQKIEPWFNGKLVVKTQPAHDEKITVVREKATLFRVWLDG